MDDRRGKDSEKTSLTKSYKESDLVKSHDHSWDMLYRRTRFFIIN